MSTKVGAAAAVGNIVRHGILSNFPADFSFCFAYGSGVKKQLGYEDEKKQRQTMIDMIFCVNDAAKWHSKNLQMNPTHYSGLANWYSSGGGGSRIAHIQNTYGARVYCNTLIPLENGQLIKYGVVSTENLVDDLLNWRYMYVAGRLHKPCEVLIEPTTQDIQSAIQLNLKSAVHVSLLLLPESFKIYDLFYTIANLSYAGDFRMYFGEKKNKVKNIVTPQLAEFYQFYLPTLLKFCSDNCIDSLSTTDVPTKLIYQNKSTDMKIHHLRNLPKLLCNGLIAANNGDAAATSTNSDQLAQMSNSLVQSIKDDIRTEAMHSLATNSKLQLILNEELRGIVWNSSVYQSLKNIPTAGVTKSIQYSWKKILKTFNM